MKGILQYRKANKLWMVFQKPLQICILVIIGMVFHHKLTQAHWCPVISASLELSPLSGNKVIPDPAALRRVADSG